MQSWRTVSLVLLLVLVGSYWAVEVYPWMRGVPGEWRAEIVTVSSDRLGRIVEGAFAEGVRIEAGRPLLSFETEWLRSQEAQAAAGLDAAQQRIEAERSEVDGAMDGYIVARRQYESGLVAQGDVDFQLLALQEAQGRCDRAMADWAVAQSRLAGIRAELKQLQIAAPCTGKVVGVYKRVGEVAQPGEPILRIAHEGNSTVIAYVPEEALSKVAIGQEAKVSFPGSSRSWYGRVMALGHEMENGALPVRIELEGETDSLRSGMHADVAIKIH